MTYRWVPLTEAVQLVLGGKVHNALAIQAVLATYAAAQNNFEACAPPRVAGSSTPTWDSAAKSRRTSATTKNGTGGGE